MRWIWLLCWRVDQYGFAFLIFVSQFDIMKTECQLAAGSRLGVHGAGRPTVIET
jgi:hypothetical protein